MSDSGFDLGRMHAYRRARIRGALEAQGVDGVVLLGTMNIEYAGLAQPCADAMRMHYEPSVVIAPADGAHIVRTPYPGGLPDDADVVGPAIELEYPEGVADLAAVLRDAFPGGARLGFDEFTSPMIDGLPELLPEFDLVDATPVMAAARLIKSTDEIACLTRSQRINERVMYDVERALRPGVRQSELSALFFDGVFRLGATANIVDPIWSPVPESLAAGTVTITGDVGFPLPSNDRFLREGDVIFSDTSISWNGYHSDFGKTWICSRDPRPSAKQRDCYLHWRELYDSTLDAIKPGGSCGDLVRAASRVDEKYKLAQLYLGHGIGVGSVEAPIIGSNLGIGFDDGIELRPGMTFILEPVIWRDGIGGFRSEEMVVVTDTGYEQISSYAYTPFEEQAA